MDKDLRISLYIRGYEEGQKEAWTEIKSLIKRYEGWDLRSRIESKLGTLYQDVASKKVELEYDPARLMVTEEKPEKPPRDEDVDWDESFYLVIEDKPRRSMYAFKELVEKGYHGLCITTEFPEKLKKSHQLPEENILFIQLQKNNYNSNATVGCIRCSPGNLTNLSTKIGDFLKKNSPPIILFHGLHSITLTNDINKVLIFIDWLKDLVHNSEGFLLTSISRSDFTEDQVGRFKVHFDDVIND